MTEAGSEHEALARVRELDEALARREPSPAASEQIRSALQARALERRFAARLRWWPALAFAAGALLMAGALWLAAERARRSAAPTIVEVDDSPAATDVIEPPSVAPAPTQTGRECAAARPGAAELLAGACMAGDGVRVTALIGSRFDWAPDRVSLAAGELLFEVESRPDRPLAVVVGVAEIAVIGTSFVVHRDAELGWISLLEGHVRVRVGADEPVELREGGQLEWSLVEPAPAPASASRPAPAPAPAIEGDEGLAELLDEVAALRRKGEYAAAVERLRAGERPRWSARARQLVSYEIGTLLERQVRDYAAACAHWREHRERFEDGRYAAIIERSMARMSCGER